MPMARPLSSGSQQSATVPAPTAWTAAAAPPLRNLITMNMLIDLDKAARTFHRAATAKDMMYIVLLPVVSLNDDHQRGKRAIASMYKAIERFVIVSSAPKSLVISVRAANRKVKTLGSCNYRAVASYVE